MVSPYFRKGVCSCCHETVVCGSLGLLVWLPIVWETVFTMPPKPAAPKAGAKAPAKAAAKPAAKPAAGKAPIAKKASGSNLAGEVWLKMCVHSAKMISKALIYSVRSLGFFGPHAVKSLISNHTVVRLLPLFC